MAFSKQELTGLLDALKGGITKRTADDPEGMVDAEYADVDIVQEGKKIILPKGMTLDEAIVWCKRKRQQEETEVTVKIKVDAFPLDGACALTDVLKEMYGWTDLTPRSTWFGEIKPEMIDVEIGPKQSRQVPWGDMQIPNLEGKLTTSFVMDDDRPCFQIVATIKRKHEKVIEKIGFAVKERVRTHSIYRSKAIRMRFRNQEGGRIEFHPGIAPKFEDLTHVKPQDLIFACETQEILETTLFTPVQFSNACREHGIPLKRGVLLEGPFGTGKTLTAAVLARICIENGWTFLYVEDVRDLDMALKFAKLYQPTVVFGEDVDRAVGMNRNSDVDRILNTLDGIGSKTHEIFVVLTTNNVDVIGPAFMRPGRIDTVVHIGPPDSEAAIKLVRLYGKGNVEGTDDDLAEAVKPVVGSNAAFLQEVTERSKLASVRRTGGAGGTITPTDIAYAAKQMEAHLKLSNPEKETSIQNPLAGFASALGDELSRGGFLKKMSSRVAEEVAERLE